MCLPAIVLPGGGVEGRNTLWRTKTAIQNHVFPPGETVIWGFLLHSQFSGGKFCHEKHGQFSGGGGGGELLGGGGGVAKLLSDSWYNCKTTFYLSVFCFSTIAGTVEKYSVPSAQTIKCPIHRPLSQ